jgi:microcompartment protein CcmL/EutN
VKSLGPQSRNANNESTFKVGDIIQIQNIDRKKRSVLCQNTDTKGDMTLSYNSPAIFTPLLDCQKYTLLEVVTNYGLPSRVCFVSTGSQADQNSDQLNSALTGLTEVVFHKVVTEVKVIATTVGGGVGELTHCIGLPTDLPIRCTVAKRLTKNGESYEDFLQTLHAGFDSKNLSERVNVFQEIGRVKIHDSSNSMTTVSRPQLPDTLPSLVRSTAPRNQPYVSPKPKKRTIMSNLSQSPKDTKCPLSNPKQSSQSHPEDSTTTTEVYDELSENRLEDSSTTAEDNYVEMGRAEENDYKNADCGKHKSSVDNQKDLPMNVSIQNPHLTGQVNAPSTPEVQNSQCNRPKINSICSNSYAEVNIMKPQCNRPNTNSIYSNSYEEVNIMKPQCSRPKTNSIYSNSYEEVNIMKPQCNQPKPNSIYSNGYEEVKPAWNSNFKQEFADPSLILNKQLSEVYSDYVIPMISPNLKSQTQEFADPNLILNEQLSEVHSNYVIPMISPNLKSQTQEFADPNLILNEQLSEVHSDYVIPMISPNLQPQTQEFADSNLILNEQLSEVHSDYVIPMISPNLQPQTKKFVIHKRTDANNKSTGSYENVECEIDKNIYEDMNPKSEWDSDSRIGFRDWKI